MAKVSESQRGAVTQFRAHSQALQSPSGLAPAPRPVPAIPGVPADPLATPAPAVPAVAPPAPPGAITAETGPRYTIPASLACSMLAGLVFVREPGHDEPPPTVPPSSDEPGTRGKPGNAEGSAPAPSPSDPTSAHAARPSADRYGHHAGGFELGREHEASLESVLLAGFDDGTGDLAVGFLRHLSSELYLLALRFCDVDRGLRDEMTHSNVERVLYRLSEQARAVAELQLRLKRERMRTDGER